MLHRRFIVSTLCILVATSSLAGALRAQVPEPDLLAQARMLVAGLGDGSDQQKREHAGVEAMRLWRQVIADPDRWSGRQIGAICSLLVRPLDLVGSPELVAMLDAGAEIVSKRPGVPDGLCQILTSRIRAGGAGGRQVAVATMPDLWRRFEGPKRYWVAADGARFLINTCSNPSAAERLLDEALEGIAPCAAWGEPERLALIHDPDVWLVGTSRSAAGTLAETQAQLLLLRGFARTLLGRLLPAMRDLTDASEKFAFVDNKQRAANCDHNLASVWLQLGRPELAIESARRALVYYQMVPREYRDPPNAERDRNGELAMNKVIAQAWMFRDQPGDLEAAERTLEELATQPRWLGETNIDALPSYAALLLRLPRTPERQQRFDAAIGWIEAHSAAHANLRIGAQGSLLQAEEAIRRCDWSHAVTLLDAVEPRVLVERVDLVVVYHELRGRIGLATGRPEVALGQAEDAARRILLEMEREALWACDGAATAWLTQFSPLLDMAWAAYEALATRGAPALPALSRLYAVVQHFHGFEALCRSRYDDVMAEARVKARSDAGYCEVVQKLAEAEARLREALSIRAPTPLGQYRRQQDIHQHEREVEEGRVAVAGRLATLVERGSLAPATHSLGEVQKHLAADDLWVECCETATRAWAFVVTREGVQLLPLPSGSSWRAAVDELEAWVTADSTTLAVAEIPALVRIAEQLWPAGGSLADLLASGRFRRLLWSPEGTFAALPLAALPLQGRPLVERILPVHVVSGSRFVYEALRSERPAPARAELSLLAFGNPRYPDPLVAAAVKRSMVGEAGLSALLASAVEVVELAKLFADDMEQRDLGQLAEVHRLDRELLGARFQVLLGSAATEGALAKARSGRARAQVLHFACHAEARSDAPGMSFLALTLADSGKVSEPNDGFVHLGELAALRGDFELVTLSACRTGAGAARSHDAVAGLAWAAQMAGARRVLASLWQVGDSSTATTMVDVYRAWIRGGRPLAEALAETQRVAIGKVPVRQWAAFVLWGSEQ
jgi:tetratricopeptide (TPR) repeat protein